MWLVSSCAGMAVLQSSLTDSFSSLVIALSAVLAAVITELALDQTPDKRSIRDGSAVATALIFSLLLPNHISPVFAALGAAFAIAVVKQSFGGLGANWLNPAVGGWLFIRFGWPGVFSGALEGSPLSLLSESLRRGFPDPQGSPLAILKISGAGGGSFDSAFTAFLNDTVFSITGTKLPGGYIDLFVFSGPGIIADRGVFALLLGTIIITAAQVNRSWVPAVYLGIYTLCVRVFGALPFGGGLGNGDGIFGLLSGGTIAAAFLLAADPVTGPKSNTGALIAALLGGILSFVFRYQGLESYGAFFAVALINALAPLIRSLETRWFYSSGRGRGL
jgi:electron transport complex protein RnfD